jgi:hypothetical protein
VTPQPALSFARQKVITDECSTDEVTMCLFEGATLSAASMAALLLSVAQLVKINSRGCAPINSATWSLALSTAPLILAPNR